VNIYLFKSIVNSTISVVVIMCFVIVIIGEYS